MLIVVLKHVKNIWIGRKRLLISFRRLESLLYNLVFYIYVIEV